MLLNRNPEQACEVCGRQFRPVKRTHKFCSDTCRVASYSPRKSCRIEGCESPSRSHTHGLCNMHRLRLQRKGDPLEHLPTKRVKAGSGCVVEGCGRADIARGYCFTHRARIERYGDPMADIPIRKQRPAGTVRTNSHGYEHVSMPGHPNANANGMILVHRKVMSDYLGRALLRSETVHHKNGDKRDNRIENLELRIGAHGQGQTVEDRVADAVRVLEQYAPHKLR